MDVFNAPASFFAPIRTGINLEKVAETSPDSQPDQGGNLSSEGTILVIDDFELNRDMLSRRLKSRGFETHTAESGLVGLEMIRNHPFDLVLLDIMMPDLDGYQVLERIRQTHSSTELAVIMVTAKDSSDDIVQALDMGADDFVPKPIDFPVALARIRSQLARRKTEVALKESEERYAIAAKGSNDGLWDWDIRGGKVHYSERWKAMLGYNPDEIGEDIDEWYRRVHPDDLPRLKEELDLHIKGASPQFACEYRIALKDGSYRWMLSRAQVVCDEGATPHRMAGWQTDTSARVEHDFLTALPNRGLFLDRVAGAIARGKRNKDFGFAVFYLGVDRFKIINESLGHEKGDQILIKLARRLENALRSGDTLARLGGDEFAILFEGVNSVGVASAMIAKIQNTLITPLHLDDQDIHITVCMGIYLGDAATEDAADALRKAHTAMDNAKSEGKDSQRFYAGELDDSLLSTLQMENELRKALDRDELFLLYQPQIDTKTGKIIGCEALVRWRSETQGIVPPFKFIPLAEETGLIIPMGDWILETACRQAKAWQDAGLPPIRMGVNLSSRQFKQNNLAETVDRILKETGLDAQWLDLELTESLLMENVEQTIIDLNNLHDLGAKISVDDFGTGYSSLSYLKRFPLHTLKIDQSFVREITTDPDDAAICTAVIRLAHSLRMNVIAEGVETRDHLEFLKDLDCDEMQGYYFSKPAEPEVVAKLLAENKSYI